MSIMSNQSIYLSGDWTFGVALQISAQRTAMPISKNPWFYKAIDKAITAFGNRHNITSRRHFAPILGYSGQNGDIQLGTALNYTTYNPATPKPLSIDQLAVLLDELGPDKKFILDAIAKECGGVFNFSAPAKVENESIKDELLTIASFAGSLSAKFLEFKNNDGLIDENEANELEHVAYETRQHLRAFEEMVKNHKKECEE